MGWRGMLRSMEADRKRKERIEHKRDRILGKASSLASKFVSSFSNEAQQELEKVKKYEETLSEKPITKCGLKFTPPNKWTFDEFSDNKGQIKYNLQLAFTDDPLNCEPNLIEFEKRNFKILSVCITPYGTFLGFEISYNKDVPGAKSTKLINKRSPESSLIAIKSGDQLFFPIEGDIDGQLIADTKRIGMAVIEPFEEQFGEFEIVFIPKEEDDENPPKTIKVSEGDFVTIYEKTFKAKSLYEKFYEMLDEKKKAYE